MNTDKSQESTKENLSFHVEKGDYFGTLATVLGLIRDVLTGNDETAKRRCVETLTYLQDDLVYLQNTHEIVKKVQ